MRSAPLGALFFLGWENGFYAAIAAVESTVRNRARTVHSATKTPPEGGVSVSNWLKAYNVDSISKPQASSRASGIYFEFLFRLAHSRKRVDRMY
jgi:hypothetical protein